MTLPVRRMLREPMERQAKVIHMMWITFAVLSAFVKHRETETAVLSTVLWIKMWITHALVDKA